MVLRLLSTIFIFISISFASSDSIDKSIVNISVSKTPNYLDHGIAQFVVLLALEV